MAWGAKPSLQEVSSKKDLKKLSPETPLDDQLKVIKKYGQHPHTNEVASHAVRDFLISGIHDLSNPRLLSFLKEFAVASAEMFDAIYNSKNPARVVCASGNRRVWKAQWPESNDDPELQRRPEL